MAILNAQQAAPQRGPGGAPSILPWPKGFDPTQQSILQGLAQKNALSGVPPQIIAYMQQAESGFGFNAGGAINSAGYGGYFGLGNNKQYPGGTSTTALLHDTSQMGYAEQAVIAASALNSYLNAGGGNWVGAENVYQTGSVSQSANGAKIFESYGIAPDAGGVVPANPAPGALGAIAGLATGGTSVPNIPNPITDVNSFFSALGSGFGLGWTGIFTIVLGIAFVVVGILFFFHRTTAQAAHAALEA